MAVRLVKPEVEKALIYKWRQPKSVVSPLDEISSVLPFCFFLQIERKEKERTNKVDKNSD